MSLTAYQKAQTATETPRDIEYRLFAQVTASLTRAKESGEKNEDYMKALDWNRRMWSTFSTDCAEEGNGLPRDLRARIISIAMWVSRYTSDVMRNGADIDALIDVNRAIMEGLASRPSAPTQTSAGQASARQAPSTQASNQSAQASPYGQPAAPQGPIRPITA